jgi:hypothetical protein
LLCLRSPLLRRLLCVEACGVTRSAAAATAPAVPVAAMPWIAMVAVSVRQLLLLLLPLRVLLYCLHSAMAECNEARYDLFRQNVQ